jgi:hypothetical protein
MKVKNYIFPIYIYIIFNTSKTNQNNVYAKITFTRYIFTGNFDCPRGFFVCPEGHCLSPRLVCDGIQHCSDGFDETYCCKLDVFFVCVVGRGVFCLSCR